MLLLCFGASSGVASLVVFALFVSSMIGAALRELRLAAILLGRHGGLELLDHADVAPDRARPYE